MLTIKSLTILLLISIVLNVILLLIIFYSSTSSIFQINPGSGGVNNTLIGKECVSDSQCLKYWSCLEGKCRCMITKVYHPVCGVDGKTYGNPSEAHCKGIEITYNGECITPSEKKCYACGNTCQLGYMFNPPVCPPTSEQLFNCMYFDGECVREDVFNNKIV